MNKQIAPKFKLDKAVAVTATFIKLSGGTCDKYWLNKVMYFVERQSLVKSGQPLFFDSMFSVPHGPIVSAVNDGIDIASYPIDSIWTRYFSLDGNTLILKEEPDFLLLSDFENNLIHDIFEQFKGWSFPEMYRYFHNLPENKETKSREVISYEEILHVEGFGQNLIQETLDEISYLNDLENILSSASQ